MKFIGIIPARYASSRFPGKPLADLGGKPMIQRVYEQASMVLDHVFVATDDVRIYDCVQSFGGQAVMTSKDHKCGTDRVYEAYSKLRNEHWPNIDDSQLVVVNIQGDEPFIQPDQIRALMGCFPTENLALVGASGVGKTTLCSLIPRFYDVTSGSIKVDGIDIRDMKLESLRNQIGIVQQDVYLFAGTIMENIRYGKPGASDEDVIRAAKRANAHEFIMSFPDGYNTDIGQRGAKLSGGQKQRLSIARVFLKNPPILIFDEATSALDNESEKVVQRSLEELAKDRTTFVIAHRLSTIRNAQRILVLTENGIAEEGTHEELMKQNGVYESLYQYQFR